MRFIADYTDDVLEKTLVYSVEDSSFDTLPQASVSDNVFYLNVDHFCLYVLDRQVVYLEAFYPLNKEWISDIDVPVSRRGNLRMEGTYTYDEHYSLTLDTVPAHINFKTGWVCLGDPNARNNAVEFINGCIAVVADYKIITLWFKIPVGLV